MLAMSFAGMTIAIVSNVAPAVNVPAAALTAALVVTALTTLRQPSVTTRWLNHASTLTVFAVGAVSLSFAVEAFANDGTRDGMFALFIAALSFFIGQAKVFPEAVRIMPLLATPVLAVLATMFVWLWRVRAGLRRYSL